MPESNETKKIMRAPLAFVEIAQDLVHYAVIVVLLIITAIVLYHTAAHLFAKSTEFATRVIDGIDGVLFAVIIMELLHTVLAHFDRAGFQLQPFLIIGIISAVRHILSLGAKLTLSKEGTGAFSHPQIELGVNAAVVLALAVSLLLVRRNAPSDED